MSGNTAGALTPPLLPTFPGLFGDEVLEPIQEVVESDESVVILCWRLIRERGSARCGSLNIALLRTAAVFVIRVI